MLAFLPRVRDKPDSEAAGVDSARDSGSESESAGAGAGVVTGTVGLESIDVDRGVALEAASRWDIWKVALYDIIYDIMSL